MPTGYTDKIKDGISFNEFIMNCARAFGALVTIRDSMGVPIPQKFEPSDYHKKEAKKYEGELKRLKELSLKEAEIESKKEFEEEKTTVENLMKESEELELKYRDMLLKANEWIPPSLDHGGLKKFMIRQIEDSIKFDCGSDYWKNNYPKLSTPEDWLRNKKIKAERDILYHQKHDFEERERTDGRNLWLTRLRDSLKEDKKGRTIK